MRVCAIMFLALFGAAQHALAITDAQRLEAIERIQSYLLEQQDPDTGSWEGRFNRTSRHYGGETALVTYALLRSGMSVQEPRVRSAVNFLQNIRMNGTYAVALRTHCWATLPDNFQSRLRADARWLLDAQSEGLFDYAKRDGPRYDHSVSQYGLLGLWESAKRNGPAGTLLWKQASRHYIASQNPDGGWAYQDSGASTATMTAAGLTALLITQEKLHLGKHKPPEDLTRAINHAIAWLDTYTAERGFSSNYQYYYLIALERSALAGGVKTLSGKDWFDEGAKLILQAESGRGQVGGSLSDTAFALLFLAHGGKPVWINKLQLHGRAWNNRPNDLNMMTRRLSDQIESELGWQFIDARSDTSAWLNAPVAYVASDEALWFSDDELANLQLYLDLGGVLVANPDSGSLAFIESIQEAALKLYPDYRFTRAEADHPLLSLIHEVTLPESQRPWVLSNGVRDLIVLAPTDWGMILQSHRGEAHSSAYKMMANLHAHATERGLNREGLDAFNVQRASRRTTGRVNAVRVLLDDKPPLEPMAWYPMAERLFNRSGVELKMQSVGVDQLDLASASIAHFAGAEPRKLSPEQLRTVAHYIQRGGTVLIETIGGRRGFADQMLHQIESVLGEKALPLPAEHRVITGVGLADGWDMRHVGYRRFSTLHRGPVDSPRLLSIRVNGRDAVFVSHEDLSMGALGVGYWGIDGYDKNSARGLLGNILLLVSQETPIEPIEVPHEDDPGPGDIEPVDIEVVVEP